MADDPLDLKGQVAFITGAGQGAGRGIALAFARHNAGGVAVNDFVVERAAEVVREIEAMGGRAVVASCDVGDYAAVKATMAMVEDKLGAITLLVNNAGNAGPNAKMGLSPVFWDTDPKDWARYFHTNLDGVMNCCHVAVPSMVKAGKGRVVTVVSDAGRVGEPRLAAYSAAKAGAAGFMRALARETGRYGITANCISLSSLAPAFSDEEMAKFMSTDQVKAQMSRYVIRRYGQPDDVAMMALFLCSDASSWITGQTYPVNGGYSFTQ